MHILIAPNAFKNSLDASTAAEAINTGLLKSKLSCITTLFPVADGGDGTANLLAKYLGAEQVGATVQDPLRRKISAEFSWSEKDKTAIIELAAASGLRLLKPSEYDPVHATTFGTGELMLAALDKGAKKIILCIGGSATVDGGTGILEALGIEFLDESNNTLNDVPASLGALEDFDSKGIDKRILHTEIIILCDVENPLLGVNGAAKVFGPQKGASTRDVELLEKRLDKLNKVVIKKIGKDIASVKHGGAAGGVAAGLNAVVNAKLVNGIDYFLAATGFDNEIKKADMVITGEGSIDSQTLHGKGPYGVAKKAKEFSLPVIGLAGTIPATDTIELKKYFDRLISINKNEADLNTAMRNTYSNLEASAYELGNELAASL